MLEKSFHVFEQQKLRQSLLLRWDLISFLCYKTSWSFTLSGNFSCQNHQLKLSKQHHQYSLIINVKSVDLSTRAYFFRFLGFTLHQFTVHWTRRHGFFLLFNPLTNPIFHVFSFIFQFSFGPLPTILLSNKTKYDAFMHQLMTILFANY